MKELRSINDMESAGTEAVKRLRKQKLMNGHPFMINSRSLPKGQCYLEYPDGIIKIASLSPSKAEFTILKNLTSTESSLIRKQYHLSA